jgi:zinc/manganese transport system substrate-binding protein
VPTRLDRAEGDIRPAGNPHIQTDPRNIATVAAALTRRMGELDQADATAFDRAQNFAGRHCRGLCARQRTRGPPSADAGIRI